jgi:hypothetical protein
MFDGGENRKVTEENCAMRLVNEKYEIEEFFDGYLNFEGEMVHSADVNTEKMKNKMITEYGNADIFKKIVSVGGDGASVNSGCLNGIFKQFSDFTQKEFDFPVFSVWCCMHQHNLALEDSTSDELFFIHLNSICAYIRGSSTRIALLQEICGDVSVKSYIIPAPAVRMAEHVKQRLYILPFGKLCKKIMVNYCFLMQAHFLIDVFDTILVPLSKKFQEKNLTIDEIVPSINNMIVQLESSLILPGQFEKKIYSCLQFDEKDNNNLNINMNQYYTVFSLKDPFDEETTVSLNMNNKDQSFTEWRGQYINELVQNFRKRFFSETDIRYKVINLLDNSKNIR